MLYNSGDNFWAAKFSRRIIRYVRQQADFVDNFSYFCSYTRMTTNHAGSSVSTHHYTFSPIYFKP